MDLLEKKADSCPICGGDELANIGERGFFSRKDYIIRVWDVQGAVLHKELIGHEGLVWSVAVSRDCNYVISGSQDFTVRVWDIEDGRPIAVFFAEDEITRVAAVGINLFLVGSADGAVHILRLQH